MPNISLSNQELENILYALDYTAEDYIYRADCEERAGTEDLDDKELLTHQNQADTFSNLYDELRKRTTQEWDP